MNVLNNRVDHSPAVHSSHHSKRVLVSGGVGVNPDTIKHETGWQRSRGRSAVGKQRHNASLAVPSHNFDQLPPIPHPVVCGRALLTHGNGSGKLGVDSIVLDLGQVEVARHAVSHGRSHVGANDDPARRASMPHRKGKHTRASVKDAWFQQDLISVHRHIERSLKRSAIGNGNAANHGRPADVHVGRKLRRRDGGRAKRRGNQDDSKKPGHLLGRGREKRKKRKKDNLSSDRRRVQQRHRNPFEPFNC